MLLTLLISCVPLAARALDASDYVRIEVRTRSNQDREDLPRTTTDRVTQRRTLTILLSGKAKEPETRTGRWTVYGRKLNGNNLTVLGSGEFNIDLARGAQQIKSGQVSTTYTPEYSTSSGRFGRRSSRVTVKKTPAEGAKYAGFSVVVKEGDKVVGETTDPVGIGKESDR